MLKTYEMLSRAFLGESQARNRYTFYASAAAKEGYELVAEVFRTTADQEKQHAKTFYQLMQELKKKNDKQCDCDLPGVSVMVQLGTTLENLQVSIAGEGEEETEMYPEIAQIAEKEGFPAIAARVRAIAQAEGYHKERFAKLLEHLQEGEMFEQVSETVWICRECGYRFVGKAAPKTCPSCLHPQAFFQRENYLI